LGRRAVVFEEHEVVRLARLAVDREGGQSAFAKRHGVDRVYINVVLNGKRRVSDSVAKALRLRKLFVAE
jgi:plasmid maintenance system antidote protein VapI